MDRLTRSQVASEANVHIETVRYYEKRGLIATAPRNESGYRMFPLQTVADIRFIKRAQEIGFTLEEIKNLLILYKKDEELPTQEMHQLALAKIEEINKKISQLEHFKALLEEVTDRAPSMWSRSKEQCPIMQKCSKGEK
ncbi:MerR family DNA-binding protein [Brevibacillus brevis]|uniref:MerR family DNA-binding protein n=1 Tax=Brevibacillus brevis TaxID=1393 RepID=UPI000D110E48|nr:MerR family DNA-binding protein [Brevibacillus brevis]PSJ68247.1 MerR family transcriptional regulator [Brevibacillus brevis]RED35759.1 MerR family mercuric resistance operon transcriptional regulator [Brevibacillus brevis]GEC89301.1 Hg(II)-responsive transcriptional regulator [Brevibacillus brevis]VEF89131.1 Mercuric resistance operon regulatory protein [Brevibacillus brevis]